MPHLVSHTLVIVIVLFQTDLSFLESSKATGFWASLCGTGSNVWVNLGISNEPSPDPAPQHMTACHAICGSRDIAEALPDLNTPTD